ncbi:MAG: hypothetical protein HOV81_14475 [Kofleriaceae bacterium]|nr:hypothetical protein [Kofleriaceae bacterium]
MRALGEPTCRVLLVSVLVACSGKSTEPKKVPKDAAVARVEKELPGSGIVHFEEPKIELPKQESFELLDPGTGDRAPLRYELTAASLTYPITTRLRSRQLANGTWGKPVDMPEISDGFTISVAEPGNVAEPGKPLAMRALAGTVAKPSREAEAYLATWRTIEKRVISVKLDARGQVGGVTFADDPDNKTSQRARDELYSRLLALAIPLPEEPVGTGAKWRVATVLRQHPAIVKQVATYTLVSRTGSKWKVAVEIQRHGEEQTVFDAALPKGAVATIVALLRKLDGTLELDATQPLPTGKLAVTSTLHVRIALPNTKVSEQIFDDTGTIAFSVKR